MACVGFGWCFFDEEILRGKEVSSLETCPENQVVTSSVIIGKFIWEIPGVPTTSLQNKKCILKITGISSS